MPLTSDEQLNKLIADFEALQVKYKALGACDTEPVGHFHWVIAQAVRGKHVRFANLEWELYDEPGAKQAARELTEQAAQVYAHIETHGRIHDMEALRNYCWKVDF